MRISERHGMVFLANPKCASNTVERYLHAHMSDVVSPEGMIRHAGPDHLFNYLREHDLDRDDFIVFTTTRNPWDRMVSLYSYALRRPDSAWHPGAVEAGSFSRFLRSETVADFQTKFGLHGFTHRSCGTRNVDVVIPTEQFSTQLPLMFARYGVEFVEIGVHANASDRGGYRDYYDDADRDFVAQLFRDDVGFGKYVF